MKKIVFALCWGLMFNFSYGQKSKNFCYNIDAFDDTKDLSAGRRHNVY